MPQARTIRTEWRNLIGSLNERLNLLENEPSNAALFLIQKACALGKFLAAFDFIGFKNNNNKIELSTKLIINNMIQCLMTKLG